MATKSSSCKRKRGADEDTARALEDRPIAHIRAVRRRWSHLLRSGTEPTSSGVATRQSMADQKPTKAWRDARSNGAPLAWKVWPWSALPPFGASSSQREHARQLASTNTARATQVDTEAGNT
eukprot:TRINITY_DN10559_c0_g1_i1.p2 TRINITY_DN10559_c0_g1~~TRINITY_DN10559_c0_g1_i1.p2  ORF type:complete len:139 (-),score=15.46 TRINITY_DN10559_c0_g1_i1:151-516(-)